MLRHGVLLLTWIAMKYQRTRSQKMRGRLKIYHIVGKCPKCSSFYEGACFQFWPFLQICIWNKKDVSPFGNILRKACGQHMLNQKFQNIRSFKGFFVFYFIYFFSPVQLIFTMVGWTVQDKNRVKQSSLVKKSELNWSTFFNVFSWLLF